MGFKFALIIFLQFSYQVDFAIGLRFKDFSQEIRIASDTDGGECEDVAGSPEVGHPIEDKKPFVGLAFDKLVQCVEDCQPGRIFLVILLGADGHRAPVNGNAEKP